MTLERGAAVLAALAEVTPKMGAMRFASRSHKEGLLGATLKD